MTLDKQPVIGTQDVFFFFVHASSETHYVTLVLNRFFFFPHG